MILCVLIPIPRNSMSQTANTHERPTIPAPEALALLPPDGGPDWNRLVFEQSPYLLQHAANPVDWYPWGEAAFKKAEAENKPIFLSIGYSTCHWCHVMEHESFEDEEVASAMNEAFVCIKVDREERPDIDQVYMTVTQAMTGQGGWPMTVVMTPDKKPFFAGTYFSKHGGYGRPGMMELVPALKNAWDTDHENVVKSADRIAEHIGGLGHGAPGGMLNSAHLDETYEELSMSFDPTHGGFGGGRNKFPVPHNLSFLLRYHDRVGQQRALDMVEKTLVEMRRGGIYDHVGFGFHRYSTDQHWLVPHFEKMLYDQATQAIAYCEAYQVTGKPEYAQTAREIFKYVMRDMTAPSGGFYSAEDADSEGVEGKFYLWTPEEVVEVLGAEDGALFNKIYGIVEGGNFYDEASGAKPGESIPHLKKSLAETAKSLEMEEGALRERLELARVKLFDAREKRVHPYKDDKILTDWNGLMIAALAKGAKALDDSAYADAARRAADFVLAEMRDENGRLLKRSRLGQSGLPAHLDDYAFFTWGLIELYEATFDARYLQEAFALNRMMLDHYWDDKHGGFFQTADDGEELLVRMKDAYDGAIPSGNAVAICNLLRLASISGDEELARCAKQSMTAFSAAIEQSPLGHSQMMIGLDYALGPNSEIVLAGDGGAETLSAMASAVRTRFVPRAVLLHRPSGENATINKLAPFTVEQIPIDDAPTAYVCQNRSCKQPVTSVKALLKNLER